MTTDTIAKTEEKPKNIGRKKKKNRLRYNEYYDIQSMLDKLYSDSKENKIFTNLLELIIDEKNIKLAYRSIKKNAGSLTSGTNEHTIEIWANKETEEYVDYVRRRLENYIPHTVRRVEIDKGNGKTRPLGIPTIEDRLIQQCIKQILEPICEAKFHPNSFGFRPNRSAENAIGAFHHRINRSHAYHVIDMDIKGFFDNVDHGKLLKQMWNLGIQDKRLICIISKMLKAEIEGVGIPTKGTPQGGILSPLLSNIVLNELDWWVSNQWETFRTNETTYSSNANKYTALRKGNLKEIYIVRYADDFKLFCKTAESAQKMYIATEEWLKKRLYLEISKEKSKIIDIRNSSSEFLGFKIKAKPKGNKYVAMSHMTEKAMKKCTENLISKVKEIRENQTAETILNYNSAVLGSQNYYKIATHVNLDFGKIAYKVDLVIRNRLKHVSTTTGKKSKAYEKFYKNNYKTIFVNGIALYPIHDVQCRTALFFTQEKCNYTEEGRKLIHDDLKNYDMNIVHYLMNNPIPTRSMEYNDNRISLYVGQLGKCGVTGIPLDIGSMEVHHKRSLSNNGTDEYKNLIFVTSNVHKIIHATDTKIIGKYCKLIQPNEIMIKKINKLRKQVGNSAI